jgi:hypothetical protein
MKVVTRIRGGQPPASHTEVNQSEFANPSASHSPTFEEIQFRLDDWLRARRELQEEHGLGTKTIEKVDLPRILRLPHGRGGRRARQIKRLMCEHEVKKQSGVRGWQSESEGRDPFKA